MVSPSEPRHGPLRGVARALWDAVAHQAPTLGPGHLICVDGPSGSGKTCFAAELVRCGAKIVHTDEMLHGWRGLPGLADSLVALLAPLSQGRAARWRRWDWDSSQWAETRTVEPGGVLVLEGVGSWSPAIAPWVSQTVWLEAPTDVLEARTRARDGGVLDPFMDTWRLDEQKLFALSGTRAHASLRLDTGRGTDCSEASPSG